MASTTCSSRVSQSWGSGVRGRVLEDVWRGPTLTSTICSSRVSRSWGSGASAVSSSRFISVLSHHSASAAAAASNSCRWGVSRRARLPPAPAPPPLWVANLETVVVTVSVMVRPPSWRVMVIVCLPPGVRVMFRSMPE